jgi:hypothetical protein
MFIGFRASHSDDPFLKNPSFSVTGKFIISRTTWAKSGRMKSLLGSVTLEK